MIIVAKYIVILFGVFLLAVGLLMLLKPTIANAYLTKAGSTNLVNYGEITIRLLPAAALVIYASYSRFPVMLYFLGWFMIATSFVLYFIPRRLHHRYALASAGFLTPKHMRLVSPFSMLFGLSIIYAVL